MTEKVAAVLERATAGEDMWKDPKFDGDYMDVAISINRLGAFKAILNAAGIEYETMIEDLGMAIDENMESGKILINYNFNLKSKLILTLLVRNRPSGIRTIM